MNKVCQHKVFSIMKSKKSKKKLYSAIFKRQGTIIKIVLKGFVITGN